MTQPVPTDAELVAGFEKSHTEREIGVFKILQSSDPLSVIHDQAGQMGEYLVYMDQIYARLELGGHITVDQMARSLLVILHYDVYSYQRLRIVATKILKVWFR